MTHFYKGVGVGTYLHLKDLKSIGIAPADPNGLFNCDMAMQHISSGPDHTPCVSVTRSYAVAEGYARTGKFPPSSGAPGYVYVIDVPKTLPPKIDVVDPVYIVAEECKNPLISPSYHHDGGQKFLIGVVSPSTHRRCLNAHPPRPPGSSVISRPPNLSQHLQTMVFALRDAEALIVGSVPSAWIIDRLPIY
jgi:hypothetical protein